MHKIKKHKLHTLHKNKYNFPNPPLILKTDVCLVSLTTFLLVLLPTVQHTSSSKLDLTLSAFSFYIPTRSKGEVCVYLLLLLIDCASLRSPFKLMQVN